LRPSLHFSPTRYLHRQSNQRRKNGTASGVGRSISHCLSSPVALPVDVAVGVGVTVPVSVGVAVAELVGVGVEV
jgi:hypothetical protein